MNNSISQHFTWKSLLRFAFPTTILMIFMSLYTMVDGFFVARFVGPDALSAINIVYPLIGVTIGMGVMLGTGGSALISNLLGQGKHRDAVQNFTRISIFALLLGLVFSGISLLFIDPIMVFLGASERLLPYCKDFLSVLLPFLPAALLQVMFGTLFVTAGKPKIGLCLILISGLLNGFLDYAFIVVLNMGISGAAWATATGYLITPVFALFYFAKPRTNLYFVKHTVDLNVIFKSCINGSSEMVSNLAGSVIAWLMNLTMMHFAGESGVAAVTVVLYTQFIFTSIFLGFSNGVAPIISYNHGSKNVKQLQSIFKICMQTIVVFSILMIVLAFLMAGPVVSIFLPKGSESYLITYHGYLLFSISYLFAGINIFTSSLFTALSNGKASAQISFARTFLFTVVNILGFSLIFGMNGLWMAVPIAEISTLVLAFIYVKKFRLTYLYY